MKYLILNICLLLSTFGIHSLRNKDDWNVKSTDKFDFYYLELDNESLDEVNEICHSEYERLMDKVGLNIGNNVHMPDKNNAFLDFRISIYLSSEIEMNDDALLEPKQILKRKIEIDPSINIDVLEKKLKFMISQIVVGNMSAGQFNNRRKMTLNRAGQWFYYGAAYFISSYKTENDEPTFAGEISSPKQLDRLTGIDAMYMGAKIFDNLEQKYGPSIIANILNLQRIVCNKERAISGTLGNDYDVIIMSLVRIYSN